MKNFLRNDINLEDFKHAIKNIKRKDENKGLQTAFMIVGIIAFSVASIFLILRIVQHINNCIHCEDFYDDEDFDGFDGQCDENGCYFTDDEDFEN